MKRWVWECGEAGLGVILYALLYQIIMSPVCVVGYAQEIFGFSRRW